MTIQLSKLLVRPADHRFFWHEVHESGYGCFLYVEENGLRAISYNRKHEVDQPLADVSDAESWTLSVEP